MEDLPQMVPGYMYVYIYILLDLLYTKLQLIPFLPFIMGEIALESPTQMIITLLCVATNACHTVYLINAIELLL